VNSTLTSVVPTLPGARIADWYAVAVGHLDWFLDDGAHLNQTGAAAYADFVAQSLAG
jgi:lysophospholipase L1-like esterase